MSGGESAMGNGRQWNESKMGTEDVWGAGADGETRRSSRWPRCCSCATSSSATSATSSPTCTSPGHLHPLARLPRPAPPTLLSHMASIFFSSSCQASAHHPLGQDSRGSIHPVSANLVVKILSSRASVD
eukprot:2268571-Rhodomonas_salina.1